MVAFHLNRRRTVGRFCPRPVKVQSHRNGNQSDEGVVLVAGLDRIDNVVLADKYDGALQGKV